MTNIQAKPYPVVKVFRNQGEIDRAIRDLNRRRVVFEKLRRASAEDQEVRNAEDRFSNTILEIYGPESPEYRDYRDFVTWPRAIKLGNPSPSEIHRFFMTGVSNAIGLISDLISSLEEKKEDLQEDSGRTAPNSNANLLAPFAGIMHQSILDLAQGRIDGGHLADAVEAAFKEINNRVKWHHKAATGRELDGFALMMAAFSATTPSIVLADLSIESGRSEQLGYMHMFAGGMSGIRNPKAHANISITSNRCVHLLMLASLLMSRLDEAGVAEL